MKKLSTCIVAVMLIFISLSGIYAVSDTSVFDMEYTENVYKFSEGTDIKLPFIRMSGERMEIDRDVNKSGISFARDGISVLNNLKGIQILSSSDTVRVTGNMEYGMVIAPTVIVEGTIEKSLIIVAENITISEKAVIKEDLLCSASKLDLLGNIEGNLLGTIGQANIEGNITKDFRVNVNDIFLATNSSIKGDIYLISTNSNINLSAVYPNATVKIIEKTNTNTIDIWEILRTSLIFALIYLLLSNKTNLIKNTLNKVKSYWRATGLSGFASILLFPLIIVVVIFLTIFGLGIIAFPVAIAYGSFILIAFVLSAIIVGCMIAEYIANKYSDKIKGTWDKLILAFCTIFMLNLITNIPMIGYTISVALCILSAGILFTAIFRRIKE